MDELNISSQTFQQLVEQTTKWLTKAIDDLETGPTTYVESTHDCPEGYKAARQLAQRLREDTAPEHGQGLAETMDLVCNVAPHAGLNHASGGFCAFITGGGLLHTAVADLVSAAMNRFTGVFLGSPGLVQLETNVIAWMSQIIGYNPQKAFGCFTSGGSMANFIGILVARRKHLSEEQLMQGVVMATSETHSCISKGLMMAGLPQTAICKVPCDDDWRMDPKELEKKIEMYTQAGRKPFLVVSTAGTTNSGTVDNVRDLATVCQRHNVWLHVDGVYGAAFKLTKRGQSVLDGLEEADSVAVDLHKSFFLPHGTGMLLVKERHHLRKAFTIDCDSPYYPDFDSSDVNFYELSPELTRSFRGMRIWLPLKICGLDKWRAALDARLDWTEFFVKELYHMKPLGIEVTTKPSLTLATFRYAPEKSTSAEQLRDYNLQLLRLINKRGNIFLSPTTLQDGRFVIRICILHLRLTKARLDSGLQDIKDGAIAVSQQAGSAATREVPQESSNLLEPVAKRPMPSDGHSDLSPPPSPNPPFGHIKSAPIDHV